MKIDLADACLSTKRIACPLRWCAWKWSLILMLKHLWKHHEWTPSRMAAWVRRKKRI